MRLPSPRVLLVAAGAITAALLSLDLTCHAYAWPGLPGPVHEIVLGVAMVAAVTGLLGDRFDEAIKLGRNIERAQRRGEHLRAVPGQRAGRRG